MSEQNTTRHPLPAAAPDGWAAYLKAPGVVGALLVSAALTLVLAIWSPLAAVLPLGGLALALAARRWRGLIWLSVLLVLLGMAALIRFAPTTVFIAFAYPTLFAACIVLAQTGRLFEALVTLVAVAGTATLLLDMFQQEMSYGDKKVIVLASMWATGEAKEPITNRLVQQFERENPQYKVAVRYDGRWVLSKNRPRLLTNKDVPDIIEGGKDELRILVNEGYAVPLDGYLAAPSPYTGRPWQEDWNPKYLEKGRFETTPLTLADGTTVPNPMEGKVAQAPGIIYNIVFFYNKALMRQIGVEQTPETWEEFRAVCDKALAAGIIPIMLDSAYKDMVADTLLQASLPDGELRKTVLGLEGHKPFTDEQYVRVFRLERELADKYLMKGWAASQWPKAQQEFATGKGLFMLNGSWLPGELRTTAVKDKNVFEMGVMPIPRFSQDAPGTFVILNSGWLVLKDGKQTEGAIKLLQFFSDKWGKPIALEDGNPVAFARDPLPPDLKEIEPALAKMRRAVYEPLAAYGPKWRTYVYWQMHADFVQAAPGSDSYLSAEQFAAKLEAATLKYRAKGGEDQWK